MTWKRKEEVTSETAYCFSLKKRKYIFCRKSFFTTKHKILKRQKRQQLKQPILMKHITEKNKQFWGNIWGEKQRKSNIWDSILFSTEEAKKYLLSKSFFTTNHKIIKRQKKGNIWSGQFWWYVWNEKRQPILLKCARWKRKKELTFETASCFLLKKRRYIFCREWFFTTKYLKNARKAN